MHCCVSRPLTLESSAASQRTHTVKILDWTVRLYACGQKVPAAMAAAEEVGYNLAGAAVEFLLWREARERAEACRCGGASECASVMVYWCNGHECLGLTHVHGFHNLRHHIQEARGKIAIFEFRRYDCEYSL